MSRTWNVIVNRDNSSKTLGQVQETTEALARCAALSKFGVEPAQEFFEVQEGFGVVGILPDDDFSVLTA